MCNREYQEAGGPKYSAVDPETNSAYGATVGMCTFIRIIARAVEAAGPNPTAKDLAAAVEGLGAHRRSAANPASFGPGKYTAPNQLYEMKFHYPCAKDKIPFDGMCIITEGDAFPIPAARLSADADRRRPRRRGSGRARRGRAGRRRRSGRRRRRRGRRSRCCPTTCCPASGPSRCRCARRCEPAARRWCSCSR